VQREPNLLLAVKRAIDSDRQPGRFLLTGSANLLLMQGVSESLAGRASYLTLWPMTRREQLGFGSCGLWEELVAAKDAEWPDLLSADTSDPEDWQALARRGGFPTPAVHMTSVEDRMVWFDGYVRTYLERDLQVLSSIAALPDFRRLMRAACFRLGQLVNQTEMARDLSLKQPTVHRYLNLLETSYLLVRLPAYSVNRTKRLLKSPKLYWGDVGLAMHLSGMAEPMGAHLENLVLLDLMVWQSGRLPNTEILYWRTTTGEEVDLVIETKGKVLPIEIKSTSRPRVRDAANLIAFQHEYGTDARAGLLLHTGTEIEWLTPTVLAAPWWKVI
jgi:predicted AAA+ superfamily ATPase